MSALTCQPGACSAALATRGTGMKATPPRSVPDGPTPYPLSTTGIQDSTKLESVLIASEGSDIGVISARRRGCTRVPLATTLECNYAASSVVATATGGGLATATGCGGPVGC